MLNKIYVRFTRPSENKLRVVISSNLRDKPIYSYSMIASVIICYMKNNYAMLIGSELSVTVVLSSLLLGIQGCSRFIGIL